VIDDQMLQRYRELLDQEDTAFDELEHAYEDGDRDHFEADLSLWAHAAQQRVIYLRRMGAELTLELT
jgi:CHASE3 domain sensor protein